MAVDEKVLVLCLDVLRWLGLSFTRVRTTPSGVLVATDSKFHLLANVLLISGFFYAFTAVNVGKFAQAMVSYKSSTIVYPLYTKLMCLTIVAFLLCGNIYNRKFVRIIDVFVRVQRKLERDFGPFERRKGRSGQETLLRFFVYAMVTTMLSLWAHANISVRVSQSFWIIQYLCFYYVTLITAQFVLTMNYAEEKLRGVNATFWKIIPPGGARASDSPAIRRKLRAWTAAVLDLREAETLANEVFGKQMFLTFLLAFSSVIVNAYYLIALNVRRTSYPWLNVFMGLGFLQAVSVALMSTGAAESAIKEANKVNELIFDFPVHLDSWRMYTKIMYFALFSHSQPMELKAWVFYAVDYDSLVKVVLTSSAITAVILQCDLLKGSLKAS